MTCSSSRLSITLKGCVVPDCAKRAKRFKLLDPEGPLRYNDEESLQRSHL
jgi:hypothetical protein